MGPRFSQRQVKADHETSLSDLPDLPQIPPVKDQLNLAITTAASGFRVQRDTRDDMFYPSRGSRVDGRVDFFGPYVGSTYAFQSYQFEVNKYLSFGKRHVLDIFGMGCGVTEIISPFRAVPVRRWVICADTRQGATAIAPCLRLKANGASSFPNASAQQCLAVSDRLRPGGVLTRQKTCSPAAERACGSIFEAAQNQSPAPTLRIAGPAGPGPWG